MCIHTLPVDIHCVNAWHASVSFLLGWKSPDTLPCSNAGSLPWETVPHELFQCGPFPEAAVFPKLLRHGSFQRLQSFSNRLLQCGSPQAPKSCQQSCSSVGFSLHGTTSFLLHGVTASFGYLPAPVWGSPWDAGGSQLHHDLCGLPGHILPLHDLPHGL